MLKNISQLKTTIEGKDHFYMCDQDSQLQHVKEALFQFLKFIGQIEDQVKEQQRQKEELEKQVQVEEVKEEPKAE